MWRAAVMPSTWPVPTSRVAENETPRPRTLCSLHRVVHTVSAIERLCQACHAE